MVTKNKQFFSGLDEFLEILEELILDLGLHVLLYHSGSRPVLREIGRDVAINEIKRFRATRIYLSDSPVNDLSLDTKNIDPARYGLVQVDLPTEHDKVLFLAQFAVKTDWFEPVSGALYDNAKGLRLYNRLIRKFRKHISTPVIAENITTGKTSVYRDIGYTQSARIFSEKGGILMQEGVKNVRFKISREASVG